MDATALDPIRTTSATGTTGVRSQGTTEAKDSGKAGAAQGKGSAQSGDTVELSQEAQARVARLQATDRAVKAHEAAHLAAAAGLAEGGANFAYTQGPDGKRYATSGEVGIDTSVPDDPKAALSKARQIRAAALAPADPSAQDRQVAAQAMRMESEASARLAEERSQTGTGRAASAAYKSASTQPPGQALDASA